MADAIDVNVIFGCANQIPFTTKASVMSFSFVKNLLPIALNVIIISRVQYRFELMFTADYDR